jgi:MraZ protein
MLLGRYYHTLEQKGRVSLPKTFRDFAQNWVITRGLDGGLFLIPLESFQKELEVLEARSFTKKAHRDFIRLMTNDALEVTPDAQGRVQLPEYLITFARLTRDLVVVGSHTRVEIWDRTAYHDYIDALEPTAAQVAESLSSPS